MRNSRTSSSRKQAIVIAVLAIAFFAPGAFGQQPTVTLDATYSCFQGAATYPGRQNPDGLNSTCYEYSVDCADGLGSRKVIVKQSLPTINETGTVFFTTGSYGTGVYSDSDPDRKATVEFMRGLGYRTLEIAWGRQNPGNAPWNRLDNRDGWVVSGGGWRQNLHAFSVLARYLHDQIVLVEGKPDLMLAQGNSGGSAQIAADLIAWQGETMWDHVILSGGPPVTNNYDRCFGSEYDSVTNPNGLGIPWNQTDTRELIDKLMGWYDPNANNPDKNWCVRHTLPPLAEQVRAYNMSLMPALHPGVPAGPGLDTDGTAYNNVLDYADYNYTDGLFQSSPITAKRTLVTFIYAQQDPQGSQNSAGKMIDAVAAQVGINWNKLQAYSVNHASELVHHGTLQGTPLRSTVPSPLDPGCDSNIHNIDATLSGSDKIKYLFDVYH
ncbi:MAG TPA: hypothetical protein VFD58_23895 [Blastocatellia bacterium]|nr:hypothetical protein [Blastocatellia bacterium]